VSFRNRSRALSDHIESCHSTAPETLPQAEDEYRAHLLDYARLEAEHRTKALTDGQDTFREVKQNRSGKKKYHCKVCNLHFQTTLSAMVAHREAHAKNKYTKVGLVKNTNCYRPEEHQVNGQTGKLFFGSDARLHKIILPPGTLLTADSLQCRNCKKYTVPYSSSRSLRSRAVAISKMNNHEEKCTPGSQKK
jgi:hypothetical protein